jgi:hypothetical protein
MGKRRRIGSKNKRLAVFSLLPWAAVANSVSLSDFTPKITSLSSQCQAVYTTTIPGCKVSDFTNSAHTCSTSCLNGLVQINALVNQNCADDDVEETSIIGLFLLGQAIQLLCSVAVVTTTTGSTEATTKATSTSTNTNSLFTTYSSTMTMSTAPSNTALSSVSTTSIFSQTLLPTTRPQPSASNGMIGNTHIAPSPSPSITSTSTSTSLKVTPPLESTAAEESQRSGNVGSGGGSPFDNIDNSEATSVRALGGIFVSIAATVLLAGVLNLG